MLRPLLSILSPSRLWFRRREATDYEHVLSRLSADIDAAAAQLASVRQRARRASVAWTIWAGLLWVIYAGVCWMMHPIVQGRERMVAVVYAPITGVPVFLYFLRRIVTWWYRRLATAEELHLRTLQKERAAKIDEIKRATKYDSLRLLLEKYDDSPEALARRGRAGAGVPGGPGAAQQQQQKAAAQQAQANAQAQGKKEFQGKGAQAALQQAQRTGAESGSSIAGPRPQPLVPQAPPMPRTWLDRLADAVLGADGEASKPTPEEQKYALICRECKAHNGLCHKSEWEEVQYICPRCGAFNSRRPSSAPVSSPWAASTSTSSSALAAQRQATATAAGAGSTPGSPLVGAASRMGAPLEMQELRAAADHPHPDVDGEEDDAPPTTPLRAGAESPAAGEEKREGLRARRSAAEEMDMD